MAVIIMMPVIVFRIKMSPIILPLEVSWIFINIIMGFIIRRSITGLFVELSLGMPTRIVITRPWSPVICKRNTGTEKYQSGSEQKDFLDIRPHRFSPSIVRF
jgi:hypothetical protein